MGIIGRFPLIEFGDSMAYENDIAFSLHFLSRAKAKGFTASLATLLWLTNLAQED